MKRFTTAEGRGQAVVAMVGCAFLFSALGTLVYSRFCTSIGAAGLYNRASVGVGFILFGISMALFTPCLYLQRLHRSHIDPAQLGRELKGVVLGFLCYGVAFVFAMGGAFFCGRDRRGWNRARDRLWRGGRLLSPLPQEELHSV